MARLPEDFHEQSVGRSYTQKFGKEGSTKGLQEIHNNVSAKTLKTSIAK